MKKYIALGVAALLTVGFVGCSPKEKKEEAKVAEKKVETIYVGTQNDYPPFCFVDAKGVLSGYDVEVIKTLNEKLPQYKFEFVAGAWDSIFLSLESEKTQIVADQIAKNAERTQKYLFSDESYFRAETVIIVKEGDGNIKTIDDLVGKNVGGLVGDSYTQLLEEYNKSHDNKINIKYTDSSAQASIYRDVESGRLDAYVNDPIMSKANIKEQGLKLKIIEAPLQFDTIALVFKKDARGEALKKAIDPVLKGLKADGTLAKLSKKWTDGEYIPQ